MSLPRRRALQGLGAAAALTAAGCARIPVSSPISATPLADQGQPGAPYVQALPPSPGASPQEVVEGFVQAGVGPEDDFAVAREYLTGAARDRWRATGGVTVYAGSEELVTTVVSASAVSLAIRVVASVDPTGVRSQPAAASARTFAFELERVHDQWRISSAPDGIYLSEAAFETLFAPVRLYFPDPRSLHLVPDHRWLPLHEGASAVLEGLVGGPQQFLVGSVHNAVPQTTGVSDAAVTAAADGTAQVTVPAAVGALPAQARALALAQLEASLRSVPSLPDVRLVWNGPDLTPAHQARAARAVPGHRAMGAGERGVVSLADPSSHAPAQLVPDLAGRVVHGPLISRDGVLAAALSEDRTAVLMAATDRSFPLREAAAGGALVAPAVDDAGWAWTATRSGSGALLALARTGGSHDLALEAAWLSGRDVRSLAIAPDATRLLVLSADGSGARLDLCAIRRGDDGAPRSVSEPVPVRTGLTDLDQVGWYDEIAVICLGADGQEPRARIAELSGSSQSLPALRVGTNRIAGTAVAESIWATTSRGDLLRSAGGEWERVDLPVLDPAFY